MWGLLLTVLELSRSPGPLCVFLHQHILSIHYLSFSPLPPVPPLLATPFSLLPLSLLWRAARAGDGGGQAETAASDGDKGMAWRPVSGGDAGVAVARVPDDLDVRRPRLDQMTWPCLRHRMDGWGNGGSRRRAA